jgi:hypothetical protein
MAPLRFEGVACSGLTFVVMTLTCKLKILQIVEMIGRTEGATLAEIMKATGWQAHSVRGYISTASKRCGIEIESTRNEGQSALQDRQADFPWLSRRDPAAVSPLLPQESSSSDRQA